MGRIRVIVAEGFEGSAEPSGLLRAVLEREGVEVAAEVVTMFDLVQLAADEQPDAVVFAADVPQHDLDRLREVTPGSKVVFVSPILTAAEAEMAEAVVERADVLASLGPVLVHLCTPGRMNARRAITEGFDRPDWIDRVRKDPVTLREILSETPGHAAEQTTDRPSISSLQDEVRAAEPPPPSDEDVVLLPDLEAPAEAARSPEANPPRRRRTDVPLHDAPVVIPAARRRRPWRLGLWSVALIALGFTSSAVLPSTIRAELVARPGGAVVRIGDRDAGRTHDGARSGRADRNRRRAEPTRAATPTTPTVTGGAGGPPGGAGGGAGEHEAAAVGPGPLTTEMPGSSVEYIAHGAPPGRSGLHHPAGGPRASLH
jgi:hypothetical protein